MRTFTLSIILTCLLSGCSNQSAKQASVLSPHFILSEQDSVLTDFLFDQGSWFGLSHPTKGWGLAAPRLLSDSNGYDFRHQLMEVFIKENGENISNPVHHYYPGSLTQTTTTNQSIITCKTIIVDHQNALMALSFTNTSKEAIDFTIDWLFPKADSISGTNLFYDLGNAQLAILPQTRSFETNQSFQVPPDRELVKYINIRHTFKSELAIELSEKSFPAAFIDNNNRWASYHRRYESLPKAKRLLASKCLQTLINNWRAPAGELAYEGLFPSYDYRWFHGFWSWDSWKHAVALAQFEPELAKNQIRTMYHFQDEHGMIADVVYRDTLIEKHNWRDTKPPLSGWAIREVFDATRDTSFVEELLPKLTNYHSWWYKNRDHNGNMLCEYGSTDGSLVAAGWESGMDNAVRFDDAEIVNVNGTAWSLNQESVDLNAYLYYEKLQLAYLNKVLGNEELSPTYQKDADTFKKSIQSRFYNESDGYFYDVLTSADTHVNVTGPEAWTTLWTQLATPEQAGKIVEKLVDSAHFNTYLPFPTLSASHPKFNPEKGYWRGPVWLDQAYFALDGMKKYGYDQEYDELKEKLLANAEGLLEKGMPIRENYHPETGAGLNAPHFSWSAAHLLMLLEDELSLDSADQ